MRTKFLHLGGPFDGRVGQAQEGVTEFWKKHENGEYRYSRVARRKFQCDKFRPKRIVNVKVDQRDKNG